MSQNITNYIGKILNSIQKIESSISTILANIGNIGENEGSLVYKEIDALNTNIQNIISSLFDSVLIGEYLDKEIDKQLEWIRNNLTYTEQLENEILTNKWKASSKRGQLMVNQYQDEKSQHVYTLIDKGRSMYMPFEGLSLLDYAINTSLALTNIIIKKQDKAGIFTFSKKVEDRVVADRKASQMERIMETLYRIETDFKETDFSRLYSDINNTIKQRSLLMLYTNFETPNSLYRQLPFLKAIAKKHLLVVIFFQNTELEQMLHKPSEHIQDVYDKVIAEKFSFEKRLIVQELTRHGIQCILTRPQELTLQSINKYLELKARGMI